MAENHRALEAARFLSVVVGVSLTDLKWVGFSGSGTGWGIRFMGTRLVHPLLEQNEQRSVMAVEQSPYKYSIKSSLPKLIRVAITEPTSP